MKKKDKTNFLFFDIVMYKVIPVIIYLLLFILLPMILLFGSDNTNAIYMLCLYIINPFAIVLMTAILTKKEISLFITLLPIIVSILAVFFIYGVKYLWVVAIYGLLSLLVNDLLRKFKSRK